MSIYDVRLFAVHLFPFICICVGWVSVKVLKAFYRFLGTGRAKSFLKYSVKWTFLYLAVFV